MASKPCAFCADGLVTGKPSYVAKRRFCSRDCAKAAFSAEINCTVICEYCSGEFRVAGPQTAKRRRFCSQECANLFINKNRIVRPMRGIEANRGRRAAREQLLNVCAICGWPDVDACHIVGVAQGGSNELYNFVMLCPNHHRMFDRGRIPREEVIAARAAVISADIAA